MQQTPPEIKDFEGDIKSRGRLVFAFWLEVCMETCDKGLVRAEGGNWKCSSTYSITAQSKWLRIYGGAESQQTRRGLWIGLRRPQNAIPQEWDLVGATGLHEHRRTFSESQA